MCNSVCPHFLTLYWHTVALFGTALCQGLPKMDIHNLWEASVKIQKRTEAEIVKIHWFNQCNDISLYKLIVQNQNHFTFLLHCRRQTWFSQVKSLENKLRPHLPIRHSDVYRVSVRSEDFFFPEILLHYLTMSILFTLIHRERLML